VPGHVRSAQLARLSSRLLPSKAVNVVCSVHSYPDIPAVAAPCALIDVAGHVRSVQLAQLPSRLLPVRGCGNERALYAVKLIAQRLPHHARLWMWLVVCAAFSLINCLAVVVRLRLWPLLAQRLLHHARLWMWLVVCAALSLPYSSRLLPSKAVACCMQCAQLAR
jgi:hypothetical protein